jgi:Holliday junction resolvase-like predicted endonuclease
MAAEVDLKRELLRLLREDEEFRLAVAGLIGLDTVILELRRLREDFNRFVELEEKRWEENWRRWEENAKRWEENERRWEENRKRWEEAYRRFEIIERRLEEHSRILEEYSKILEEHSKRLEELTLVLRDHGLKIGELSRRVSNLEVAVGALAESTYARYFYEDLLRELASRGEVVVRRVRNVRADEEDIDLLVETQLRVYVVEVKLRPKHEDVGRVLAKVDVVRRLYPGKDVVGVLVGAMVGREVEAYAREKRVEVYAY